MKRYIKVAAVQMDIGPLQSQKNVTKALSLMEKAIDKNGQIDLFVLPEDFITGPIPQHTATHCLTNESEEVIVFKKFAKKNKTHIVLGSFIKQIGKKFFNTTLVLNNKGEIILEHHKTKPAPAERHYIAKGSNLAIAKTNIGNIGILNCWEIADPLIARTLVKQGADILCCPSYWCMADLPESIATLNDNFDRQFINTCFPALSYQYGTLVVYANVCGDAKVQLKTKQIACMGAGQSQICAPVYGRVAHMPDSKQEGFIVYKYDHNLAAIAEKVTRAKEDILQKQFYLNVRKSTNI